MEKRRKNFYLLRLKNSSVPELIYRLKQTFFIGRLGISPKRKRSYSVQVPIMSRSDVEELKPPSLKLEADEKIVNSIIGGKFFSLHSNGYNIESFQEQNSHIFFSDIKPSDLPLDIRSAWEPARLQHITILLAYLQNNTNIIDTDTLKQFAKKGVLQWIEDNPFLCGPHYISAMECGLRIPVFFYALKQLEDLTSREYQLILGTIFCHAKWISRGISLYSSLGNHTVAECMGLIFAGAIFRKTKAGKQWLERGCMLLRTVLRHQVLEDGGPVEQSLKYHRFVLDLYWLCVDFLEKNNLFDCSDVKPKLSLGEHFLSAFEDCRRHIPSIGDSDNGHAVAPNVSPRRVEGRRNKPKIKISEHSGYTIINLKNRAMLIFDHGPLGMPPLYNHGHADALSIILTKEDQEILVDSGTYRYNGVPEWRKYFKGTRAHNTVNIDGLDQAIQETSFIWSKPYRAELIKFEKTDDRVVLEAFHDGYSRLKSPVWHKRSIIYLDETIIIIKDTFCGKGKHNFELNYHFHPQTVLVKESDWWRIDTQKFSVFMKILGDEDFVVIKGQESPLLGWYSPCYGMKEACNVLNCQKSGFTNEISFITAICLEVPDPKKNLEEIAAEF